MISFLKKNCRKFISLIFAIYAAYDAYKMVEI